MPSAAPIRTSRAKSRWGFETCSKKRLSRPAPRDGGTRTGLPGSWVAIDDLLEATRTRCSVDLRHSFESKSIGVIDVGEKLQGKAVVVILMRNG